ncbi:hypothetical protein [Clostridium sp. BJN0013]|jgi:hypothetical protein
MDALTEKKLRECELDNNGELYDPVSGETFKDIDVLTDEEVKIFVEG